MLPACAHDNPVGQGPAITSKETGVRVPKVMPQIGGRTGAQTPEPDFMITGHAGPPCSPALQPAHSIPVQAVRVLLGEWPLSRWPWLLPLEDTGIWPGEQEPGGGQDMGTNNHIFRRGSKVVGTQGRTRQTAAPGSRKAGLGFSEEVVEGGSAAWGWLERLQERLAEVPHGQGADRPALRRGFGFPESSPRLEDRALLQAVSAPRMPSVARWVPSASQGTMPLGQLPCFCLCQCGFFTLPRRAVAAPRHPTLGLGVTGVL
ncbi:uncharacterized protein LOC108306507 [Cebus imitator]|uniref:uncharacterized protein LOC108306507 n=1 Tax=Cebus imitator TaxID=2715852 RepID=UPI00080A470C|nr:uncharacterized protein LOC108306507 [Cebus imitator]